MLFVAIPGGLSRLDDWTLEYNNHSLKMLELRSPNHCTKNIASSLSCLERRIINKVSRPNLDVITLALFHQEKTKTTVKITKIATEVNNYF